MPSESFNITNSGTIYVYQWILDDSISLLDINQIPKDPKTNKFYLYAITASRQDFQIWMTLESWDDNTSYQPIPKVMAADNGEAYIDGDYKTASKNLFPSLILAVNVTQSWSIEINENVWVWTSNDWSKNRLKFILNWSTQNLPYSFENSQPIATATTFSWLLTENDDKLSTDSSYSSCADIFTKNRYFWPWSYEIRDTYNQALVTMPCDCSSWAGTPSCSSSWVTYTGLYPILNHYSPSEQHYHLHLIHHCLECTVWLHQH